MKPYEHAVSSARRFGGKPEDYLAVHNWLDESKRCLADVRHRALRHHAEGIFQAEQFFGALRAAREGLGELPVTLRNSDGREVSIRDVAEQHVLEDLGWIPTVQDWLGGLPLKLWMTRVGPRPGRPWADPRVETGTAPVD
jgi:hypothetical protein